MSVCLSPKAATLVVLALLLGPGVFLRGRAVLVSVACLAVCGSERCHFNKPFLQLE